MGVCKFKKGVTSVNAATVQLLMDTSTVMENGLTDEMSQDLNKMLRSLVKSGGSVNVNQMIPNIYLLGGIMKDQALVLSDMEVTAKEAAQTAETAGTILSRSIELYGVWYKDNFSTVLTEHIIDNDRLREQLDALFSSKRIDTIRKNFKRLPTEQKEKLELALNEIEIAKSENMLSEPKHLADVLDVIIENRMLRGPKGIRTLMKKEVDKIEVVDVEGSEIEIVPPFSGFVTKNAASFYAKTTAGICTANDVALFNRPDHFHINLERNGVIFGNIQGYRIEHAGERALLFRGFNPSASYVTPGNAETYAKGMISIVKQFAKQNGIENVFIAEQLGSWHALSNRTDVADSLKAMYFNRENATEADFAITSAKSISKMYKIT